MTRALERGSERPPALAGAWYPAAAEALARAVDRWLLAARDVPAPGPIETLMVPHAGHVYCGAVAGLGFGAVRNAAMTPPRVVLVGPAHRVPFAGLALGDFEAFLHPLGPTAVDRGALSALEEAGLGAFVPHAHDAEHCLEVLLPFMARALPACPIVPILVGLGDDKAVAAQLDRALDLVVRPGDLLVISSDLSHFHPYHEARAIDLETLRRVVALEPDLDGDRACGYRGVAAAIRRALSRGQVAQLLGYETSGDTAGDKRSVVGYGAVCFGPAA